MNDRVNADVSHSGAEGEGLEKPSIHLTIPYIPKTINVRWLGDVALDDAAVVEAPSSLTLTREERDATLAKFAATNEERVKQNLVPHSNAPRLRFEGTHEHEGALSILASRGILYGEHHEGRFTFGVGEDKVINPLTMYALLLVKDAAGKEYFVGGVWGTKLADQPGKIASAPVGFLDAPYEGEEMRNFTEEIRHKLQKQVRFSDDPDSQERIIDAALAAMRVRALISGVNQDTTVLMFTHCDVPAESIALADPKYDAKVLIPVEDAVLSEILQSGRFEGHEMNDLFLTGLAIKLKELRMDHAPF